MRVIRSYRHLAPAERGAAVAIGNFDGVHVGHRALLAAVRGAAERLGARPGVITFEPHPREVLQPNKAPKRLTPLRVKAGLLRREGMDLLVALPFTAALRAKSPEGFVRDVLVDGLAVRHVVVGYDFRFGFRAAGDAAALERLGDAHGFAVDCMPPVEAGGRICSSTRIRDAVAEGDVALAADLLGHPYMLEGRVVAGDRRGRELGYPTANLRPLGRNALVPPAGVYAVRAGREGVAGWTPGVASLGWRPTFAGTSFRIEVHLFDTAADLYGERLCCAFIARLRGEERFDSADALIRQMDRDALDAKEALARVPAPAGSG